MTTISEHRLYLLENGIVEPCADDLAGLIEELRDVRDKLDEAESRVRLWNDQTKRIEELETTILRVASRLWRRRKRDDLRG